MQLRPYQQKLLLLSRNYGSQGLRRQLFFLPTGGGKTVVASQIIQNASRAGHRCLFVVRSEPLIPQTIAKLSAFGIDCGVIKAGYPEELSHQVQVATIQTMNSRGLYPEAEVVILDEGHGATAAQYDPVFARYQSKYILGLTATPFRTKKRESLADRFDVLVGSLQTIDLIEEGALVPPVVYGFAETLDLSGVQTIQGDFNLKALAVACNTPEMIRSAIAEYRTHALGRRAVAFCVNLEHSQALVGALLQAGIPAEHIDGATPAEERQSMYARLRSKETLVLSSVGVLCEGFDEPSAEVMLGLRPTQSRVLWLQQVGRVLRLSPSTGKTHAIILDQAGNAYRHGLPTDPIPLSLQDAPLEQVKGNGDAPVKRCQACGAIVAAGSAQCPECGHEFPKTDSKVIIQGAMSKLEPKALLQARLEHWRTMAKARRLKAWWVFNQFSQAYPNPTLEQLQAVARCLGYKRGWAQHRFYELYPDLAPSTPEASTTPTREPVLR